MEVHGGIRGGLRRSTWMRCAMRPCAVFCEAPRWSRSLAIALLVAVAYYPLSPLSFLALVLAHARARAFGRLLSFPPQVHLRLLPSP
eukprot:2237583-Pleurochrysis_carterae.AAC.2